VARFLHFVSAARHRAKHGSNRAFKCRHYPCTRVQCNLFSNNHSTIDLTIFEIAISWQWELQNFVLGIKWN